MTAMDVKELARLGEILRGARERAGLSQAEAARRLGSSPATLVQWEYGRVAPTVASLRKLAALYGIGPAGLGDALLGNTAALPEPPAPPHTEGVA